jgi:hypothetical protein
MTFAKAGSLQSALNGKSQVPGNTQAVPEPLTILGALTAVGFGVAFKRYATKVNGNLQSASL